MLALLFPGQGAQEVGMGRDLYEESPAARAAFAAADEALGFPLSRLCFEGPADQLQQTETQQPAILTVSIAALRAVEEAAGAKLEPAFVCGHSLGEYSALVAADALPLSAAVQLVRRRGRFMQEAVPQGQGTMAAVLGAPPSAVAEACAKAAAQSGEVVSPANENAPQQTVIAGAKAAVQLAGQAALAAGAKRVVPLAVSAPFHCALMQPAAEKLAAELARVQFRPPRVPVITNVEAAPNADAARIPGLLTKQVTHKVRFTECIGRLAAEGVTRTAELGPGRVLSGLVARTNREVQRLAAGNMREAAELAAQLA